MSDIQSPFGRGSYVVGGSIPPLSEEELVVVQAFTKLYCKRAIDVPARCLQQSWMGYIVGKMPTDMIKYQEIIFETRPDVIIETGTAFGGSALFFANMFDLVGSGRVITIDPSFQPSRPDQPDRPRHGRITYLRGLSTEPAIVEYVRGSIGVGETVMIVLDSDHSCANVLAELDTYAAMVTTGCYLIVEDGWLNGHPVMEAYGPGPTEAIREFLNRDSRFEQDFEREHLMLTQNPGGYLRRKPT